MMHTSLETTGCQSWGRTPASSQTRTCEEEERRGSTARPVDPALTDSARIRSQNWVHAVTRSASMNIMTFCSDVSAPPSQSWERQTEQTSRPEPVDGHHGREEGHDYGYDYCQPDGRMAVPSDTSSSSHPQPLTRCPCDPHHAVDGPIHEYRRHQRRQRLLLPHRHALRQTACHTSVNLPVILLLVMTSTSFLSSARPVVWVTASAVPAGAASPTASSTGPFGGSPLTSRSSGLDSPLFSSGYPFMGERRLSSRTVTTKYGSLRGVTLTLPNRGLQSIEVFLVLKGGKDVVRVPVTVFIPGDSFSSLNSGSAYDGSVLSAYGNIVVVTINYRLGVLGFLSGVNTNNRGTNNVLMDQIAALHWIQENIGEFGGDASNVTITGHGYGSACVNLLMHTDLGRGLFHRTITHSATAHGACSPAASNAAKYAREVAAFLSCPVEGKKTTQMVECLRRKSVEELLAADSLLLLSSLNTSNAKSTTGSSLRFPVEDSFPGSSFNGTKTKIQSIDASNVVQQQRHPSQESSDLRSYPLGTSNVISNNHAANNNYNNKSKGVSSESRNSGNNRSSGNSSGYTTAISVVVIGVAFLLVNILLLVREYLKRDKSPLNSGRKTERSPKTQAGTPFSRDSSPTSNQLHIIQSHLHQRCLLLNESLDDLCSKQEAINQQQEQNSSPRRRLDSECRQELQTTSSSVTGNMSFHPELVSGHQYTSPHHQYSQSFHHHLHQRQATHDHETDSWNRQTQPHSYHHHHHHQHHLPQPESGVSGSVGGYGARVSTSGSSFNSGSLSSSVCSVLNHSRLAHNDFSKSLPRNEGGKKVSFVNPTDSLIIYGGGGSGCGSGDEIKSSDTQV